MEKKVFFKIHFTQFWICVWDYHDAILFAKLRFQTMSRPREKEAGVFKFLIRFVEHFQTSPFSWSISVDRRLNCRNKAASSNLSEIVWMLCYVRRLLISEIPGGWKQTIRQWRGFYSRGQPLFPRKHLRDTRGTIISGKTFTSTRR